MAVIDAARGAGVQRGRDRDGRDAEEIADAGSTVSCRVLECARADAGGPAPSALRPEFARTLHEAKENAGSSRFSDHVQRSIRVLSSGSVSLRPLPFRGRGCRGAGGGVLLLLQIFGLGFEDVGFLDQLLLLRRILLEQRLLAEQDVLVAQRLEVFARSAPAPCSRTRCRRGRIRAPWPGFPSQTSCRGAACQSSRRRWCATPRGCSARPWRAAFHASIVFSKLSLAVVVAGEQLNSPARRSAAGSMAFCSICSASS